MVFSSTLFLFGFLPMVLALYFAMPWLAWRNGVLLTTSLLFYAWGEPSGIILMLVSIGVNWGLALAAERKRARWVLISAVALNLGLLGWFKYANFFSDILLSISHGLGGPAWEWSKIPLPIGISFFTFQAMSYVIDVYLGKTRARRNPFDVGLYIALFPQLVAGPIVRFTDIAEQMDQRSVTVSDFAEGVQRFLVGLGKKVLIANSLAVPTDAIFSLRADELTMTLAWLGAICHTLQIYFDFSGYSDMAIGLGRMFGFRFLENFNYPYISESMTEFWRRWHISLSVWFRDYVYIPLGGNRLGAMRTSLNLIIVFGLCGLWHGANWTFVAWGFYNGALLMMERVGLGKILAKLPRIVRCVYVMLAVIFGFMLFRAENFSQAGHFAQAMTGWVYVDSIPVGNFLKPAILLALMAGVIGATPWPNEWATHWRRQSEATVARTLVFELIRLVFLGLIMAFCVMLLAGGSYNPFIYFRF